jgi:hypothetical protein
MNGSKQGAGSASLLAECFLFHNGDANGYVLTHIYSER